MALGVRMPLAAAAAAHALQSPILTPDATREEEEEEATGNGVDEVDEPESPEVCFRSLLHRFSLFLHSIT